MLILFVVLLYFMPGYIIWSGKNLNNPFYKLFLYILSSVIVSTFVIFWLFFLKINSYFEIYLILFLFLISALLRILLNNITFNAKFNFNKIDLISGVVLLIFFFVVLFLYSPIIRPISLDGFTFYQMPHIGDLYKHLYTVTTIKEHGLMPLHPYLSSVPMFYYFGYYLVPAVLCKLINVSVPYSFYIHFVFSTLLFCLFVFITSLSFVKWFNRILFSMFCTFAFGLDIVGTFITSKFLNQPFFDHIEAWGWKFGSKLQISSPFVAAIWVPQHLFASVLLFCLLFVLTKWNNCYSKYFVSGILLATIAICSIFVAFSAVILVVIYFVFEFIKNIHNIKNVFLYGLFMLLICIFLYLPFYLFSFSRSSNLLQFWLDNHGGFYKFISWLFFEWGILIILFVIFTKYLWNKQRLLLIWSWSIILFTLFLLHLGLMIWE